MILTSSKQLKELPGRIISLVPSLTELLHHLGLNEKIIGITKFCVYPSDWAQTKNIVGGTKNINIALIQKLQPDLIIANKEENVKEQIEELAATFNVWLTDINNLQDAFEMIHDVGNLTGASLQADDLINNIKTAFNLIPHSVTKIKTAYFIWRKPYMTIGGNTFIHAMLTHCGFENVYAEKKRYPEIKLAALQKSNCELLLLSSEPYPFQQKHIDELQPYLPNTKIILVNGEFFSWYGSRLLLAPKYFSKLVNKYQFEC